MNRKAAATAPASSTAETLEERLKRAKRGAQRVDAMNELAHSLFEKDNRRALKLSAEALRLATILGDEKRMAWSGCRLAGARAIVGNYASAFTEARLAHQRFVRCADEHGQATALQVIGTAYYYLNQFRKAHGFLEKSAALYRRLGRTRNALMVQDSLGAICVHLGDRVRAEKILSANRRQAAAAGEPLIELAALNKLGHLRQRAGSAVAARGLFSAALRLATRHKFITWEADCLNQLGRLALAGKHEAEARASFRRSRTLADGMGNLQTGADARRGLGECALARGRLKEAEKIFAGLAALGGPSELYCRLYGLTGVSRVRRLQERGADALHFARRAEACLTGDESPEHAALVHTELAAAHKLLGDAEPWRRHQKLADKFAALA